jgi:hypothetical protein
MNFTESKLQESCAAVGLGAEDRALVTAWLPLLDPQVEPMARLYYRHLATTDVGHLLGPDRFEQLLAARIAHWRLLLRGDFEAVSNDYVDRFGRRLFDAGFPMRIFVVATDWFTIEFMRFIDACGDLPDDVRPLLRTAVTKYAFLDLLLAQASHEVAYLD